MKRIIAAGRKAVECGAARYDPHAAHGPDMGHYGLEYKAQCGRQFAPSFNANAQELSAQEPPPLWAPHLFFTSFWAGCPIGTQQKKKSS